MKAILKIALLSIVLFSTFSFKVAEPLKIETIVIKTAIYCNHCKECGSCGGYLEEKLVKEKGIKKIVLDEKAMTITVSYNPKKTTPAKIRIAISKMGYDADEVKADPIAYSELDGCCRKH